MAPSDRILVINPNHQNIWRFIKFSSILPFQWDERLQRLLSGLPEERPEGVTPTA